MATKKKPVDAAKKLLITAMRKTINVNTVLPILEDVLFLPEVAVVCDLENFVQIPFTLPGVPKKGICIPGKILESIIGMTDTLNVKVDEKHGVTFMDGTREIKVQGENPGNYPITPSGDWKSIGTILEPQIEDMATALMFVSNDDLRPAMTGILFGKHIAATDAHRLFWKDITPMKQEFILPAKTAKIILALGGKKWEVFHNGTHVRWINENMVEVVSRVIDARFPDYNVVIPDLKDVAGYITACPSMLMKEISNAQKFANKVTNQVVFELDDKVKVHSADVDFSFEYKNEVKGASVTFTNPSTKEMQLAFNGKFLTQVLGFTPADSPVEIAFWGPTKAAIFNKHYLIMPLMMNS